MPQTPNDSLRNIITTYIPIAAAVLIVICSVKIIIYYNYFNIPIFNFMELGEVFTAMLNMLSQLKYFIVFSMLILVYGIEINRLGIAWRIASVILILMLFLVLITFNVFTDLILPLGLALLLLIPSMILENITISRRAYHTIFLAVGVILAVVAYNIYIDSNSSTYPNVLFLLSLFYLCKVLFGISLSNIQQDLVIPGAIISFLIVYSYTTAKEEAGNVKRPDYAYRETIIIKKGDSIPIVTNDLLLFVGRIKNHVFLYDTADSLAIVLPVDNIEEMKFKNRNRMELYESP